MPDTQQLEASARRALDALAMLILDNPDPGTEALGAQYELRQALFGQPSEFPAIRVWQIQAQRRDGSWNNYSAPIVDEAEAHGDYAETVANSGQHRAFRLVSSVTTQTVEAQHPEAETRTNWVPGPVAVARAAAAAQSGRQQAALTRIGQMTDHWEQHLPEVIRTPAVVSAIRAVLERTAVTQPGQEA